jgi:hypothetical protein
VERRRIVARLRSGALPQHTDCLHESRHSARFGHMRAFTEAS